MIEIELLPAEYGDCIWLRYGTDEAHLSHLLIDAGFESTGNDLRGRLRNDDTLRLDLFVMTHIDADHIEGSVFLLQDDDSIGGSRVNEAWFNGWKHIDAIAPDAMGALQGEYFGALLRARKIEWNASFKGKAVVVLADEPLPTRTLPGGMKITLLSPTVDKLRKLRSFWLTDLKHKLNPGDEKAALKLLDQQAKYAPDALGASTNVEKLSQLAFKQDNSPSNGSSIAFIAEYESKKLLFAGDAHPSVILDSLNRYQPAGKIDLQVLKVAHHGSKANTNPELLARLRVRHALISTNGAKFKHPDAECVARLIKAGVENLHFNYASDYTSPWDDKTLKKQWGYSAHYGTNGALSLRLV